MTPATLHALRRLLFFSVDEAALWLAAGEKRPQGVAARSWQYWERGERIIPADVVDTVVRLCAWRTEAIATADAQMAALQARHGGRGGGSSMVWYQSVKDWLTLPGRTPLLWRPQCSVVSDLAARHGSHLVYFDAPAYRHWLGRRTDSETMRGQWAAEAGKA